MSLHSAISMVEEMILMCDEEALEAILEIISDGMEAGQGDYNEQAWESACVVLENLKDAVKDFGSSMGWTL